MCTSGVFADDIAKVGVEPGNIYATLSGTVDLLEIGYDANQLKNTSPYFPIQVGITISKPDTKEILYMNQVCLI